METFDEEILAKSLAYLDARTQAKKPFFLWHNSTRNHVFIHLKKASQDRSRAGHEDTFGGGLQEHDGHVGQLLAKLQETGLPTDRYIDGIDQSSFLLVDNGRAKREKVYIWVERDLMAMRMYEYKLHVKILQTHAPWLDIDMSTKADIGLAPWLFNLYIDPKEQYPVGHRMNAFLAPMGAELRAHVATFKKYPPKKIGLEQ